MEPNELSQKLIKAVNAADLTAVVDLYEETAVLELPDGAHARGRVAISAFWEGFLASRPQLALGHQLPALYQGDLALTMTQVGDDATVEVARRQADGSWRWIIDRPSIRALQPPA
jgi:ketosteroid isomerase-like protein